ncbi:metal-dependent hydrolase family protein [Pelagibacterium xiamenense]|uniref:metal-dependent hydrolase family protein n=1 Tax=Pelagibacterium xiamenense TaxID=2901140 RepID=UPI001E4AB923|nr:amidohydrolase family protein [Pelagibacterium xiamenense]MCD7061427.1 amidohydrolase family protein [Pelagibacterium xiamenense]
MTLIAFTNARLPDLEAETLTEPTAVTVDGGRIVGVGRPVPADARVIDLAGQTLMPGLIDSHFHVVAHSLNLWANAIAPDSLAAFRAAAVMEELLDRGFTTVRDLGGADLGLVRAVEDGYIDGPDLVICGKGLSMTGGHTDLRERTDVRPDALGWRLGNMGVLVDGVDNVRATCRKMLKEGARFIKVMANGGVSSPNDPIDSIQYSDDEIRAMVEEARNANTYVSAHVYHDAAIRRCVELGVHSLEHCNLITPETARRAADAGCIAVPTLVAYEGLKLEGAALGLGASEQAKIDVVRDRGLESLAIMRDAGLPMAFGTDLLGELRKYGGMEFDLLAKVLTPAQIIESATIVGARLCGLEGKIGVIAEGARADMIVVDGDPFADVTILGKPEKHLTRVIKGGRIARETDHAGGKSA